MARAWPLSLQPVGGVKPSIERASMLGPQPASGPPRAVSSPTAHWKIIYSRIRCMTIPQILTWRGLFGMPGGAKANQIMVSPWAFRTTPRTLAGLRISAPIPFSDGSSFSDTSEFGPSTSDFAFVGATAAWATAATFQLTGATGLQLQAGQYFTAGLGDQRRLYLLGQANQRVGSTTLWDCVFSPPLRCAAADGDPIDAEDPRCPCVVSGSEPGLQLDGNWGGYVDLTFEETPW